VYFETDTGGNPAQPSRKPLDEITSMSAVELVARLGKKQVSARDVLAAHLAQVDRLNAKVNAIVTLVAERAMADAARADELIARGGSLGALHGLPVAHKDLVDTEGIRTTRGSPFYRDHVPTRDASIVTRIRAAGAITIDGNSGDWNLAQFMTKPGSALMMTFSNDPHLGMTDGQFSGAAVVFPATVTFGAARRTASLQ
jgi:amidase